jgi:hypothetical protein
MRSRLLVIALLAAGCTPDLCSRHSDCAPGLVCTAAGQCAKAPADAGGDGTSDGSTVTTVDAAAADTPLDGEPVIQGQGR